MRFRINNTEIISLAFAVQLAEAAIQEMEDNPKGLLSAKWRQAEIEDGGERVSNLLRPAIKEAKETVNRLSIATGVRLE